MPRQTPPHSRRAPLKISRRTFLTGAVTAGAGAGALLTGCGGDIQPPRLGPSERFLQEFEVWVFTAMIPEPTRSLYYSVDAAGRTRDPGIGLEISDQAWLASDHQLAMRSLMDASVWPSGRWHIVRDLLGTGTMDNLRGAWHGGGVKHIEAIEAGLNPLNPVELNSGRTSRQHLVVFNGTNGPGWTTGAVSCLFVYHTARAAGYEDADVSLLLRTHEEPNPEVIELRGQNMMRFPTAPRIDVADSLVTRPRVVEAIKGVSARSEDLITIWYSGHGSTDALAVTVLDGFIDQDALGVTLSSKDYAHLIVVNDSSESDDFNAGLTLPRNVLSVAPNPSSGTITLGNWSIILASNLFGTESMATAGPDEYYLRNFRDGELVGRYVCDVTDEGGEPVLSGDLGPAL